MHAATLCSRSIASQNPQPLQEQMEQEPRRLMPRTVDALDSGRRHSCLWICPCCVAAELDSPCAASAVTPLLSFSL